MSMAQEIDYTTLKWVKNEIDESLDQTRQALEAYVENPNDSTQIRFCATYLHQVYGTLQMVEIYGGALLAEEMEHLTHAIEQNKVQNPDDAYDALMRAILQLPSYLEHLEQGQQDMPVILLPLLNDLRAARGEHLLSENAFFSPNLAVAPPAPTEEDHKQVEIKKFAKKLRSVYQSSLVGLYRNQDVKNNLKKMGAVLRELVNSASSDNASRLWWVAGGLIEAILQGGLKLNNPVKQVIGQIDPYIKNLITKGEEIFEEQPPHDLLKNLLYYIARSTSNGKRVTQIKAAFNLEQMLPSGNDISEAFDKLRGSNSELMRSVSAVIKEDLLQIKDQLDVFVRSKERTAEQMRPFADQLSRISDTLAMLGLGDLHKIIQDQISAISTVIDSNESPSETSLMEIASALLYIESSLEGVDNNVLAKHRTDVQDDSEQTMLPDSEKLQLNNLVIKEAIEVLAAVKEGFNTFANEPTNADIIAETPGLLNQVRGVLSVLNISHAANLLHSAIEYIRVELLENRKQPNQAALDALADVISSIEYFLESLLESRVQPESLLKVAEQSIARLGITVEEYQPGSTREHAEQAKADTEDTMAEAAPEVPMLEMHEPEMPELELAESQSPETAEPEIPELSDIAEAVVETEQAVSPEMIEPEPAAVEVEQPQAEPAAESTQPEQEIDEEILEIFLEEADEVYAEMQQNLQAWKDNHNNEEALTVLRRSYHTLKGSGRLAGAVVLGEFAWAMENMLNQVIKGKILATPQVFQLLSNAEQALTELLNQLKNLSLPIPNVQPLADAADKLADGETLPFVPTVGETTAAAEFAEAEIPAAEQPVEAEPISEAAVDNETPAGQTETSSAEVVEMPSQDSMLSDIFRKETAAHLASIQQYLDDYPGEQEAAVTEPLLRALHTLHGSARMASADDIAAVSEALHRYFRTLHDTHQHVSQQAYDALTQGTGIINTLLDATDENHALPDHYQALLEQIQSLHEAAHAVVPPPTLEAEPSEVVMAQDVDEDAELISIFMEEAADILSGLGEQLQQWHDDLSSKDTMDEIQRALHTLKGGARMAGVFAIADLSHSMESLLQRLLGSDITPGEDIHELIQSCHDWIASAIDDLRNQAPIEASTDLLSRLEQITGNLEAGVAPSVAPSTAEPALEDNIPELTVEATSLDTTATQAVEEQPAEMASEAESVVDEEDEDLLNIFLEEAQEIQENTEHTLQQWHENTNNLDHVAELQRALHTLKGGARMANIKPVADMSHTIETLLEKINAGQLVITDTLPTLVHECHDWLSVAIENLRNQQTIEPANELIERLEQAANGEAAAQVVPHAETEVEVQEEVTADDTVMDEAGEAETIELESTAAIEVPDFATASTASLEQPAFAGEDEAEYDAELVEIFLEEAEEIQETTDRILQQWHNDIANKGLIAEMQRALHTLKGGARMANLSPIGDLSHAIESLLESVTENRIEPTASFPKVVQSCHDWLSHAIDNVKNYKALSTDSELIQQLEDLAAGRAVKAQRKAEAAAPAPVEAEQPTAELIELPVAKRDENAEQAPIIAEQQRVRNRDEQVRVRADLLDNLVNNASETSIYNSRIGQQLGAWRFNLTELSQTVVRLQEQLRKFEIETEAQIMYRHTTAVNGETDEIDEIDNNPDFDPLELDRFSYMQQLSRGMVESLSDLTSIQDLMENVSEEADALLLQQSRINTDLQEGLIRTRLTPFSSILPRLRRIVRQTCTETDKEAQLVVEGAEGEMDRTQLNRLVPALEHILRNAVDHGIETPDERVKAGKESYGTITMMFSREGSEVALYISDDGRGINTDAIRKKAIERGLLKKGARISDNEVTEFILQSGFSTAEQVTQISGRGVGMDVVNTEIKQLNGSLHIETSTGRGTHFIVRLPLTVLTNQALLLDVDEKTYAIPLSNIEHVIRVNGNELGQLVNGEQTHYTYAGNEYEHLGVGRVLHGTTPPAIGGKEKQPLLLCRSGEHRVAVHVDQLVGRQEIVVKSVGPQLSTVNNISGATILPNGEVALILDLNTLIRSSMALKQLGDEELPQQPQFAKVEEEGPITVMIVDDSITVRKVTERLLKRHNFATITAKDGVDALTQLLETIPDIMLLDVEMPRMDGYELATAIRNDERLKHLPIIMITSRTGEKHRDRAMNVGVNMLMGKPYQEHDLLENIDSLINNQSERLIN